MQMCAWRKLLDVGPSINSRSLVELHTTLTLVSAGCRVLELFLPPESSFTGCGVFCNPEIPCSDSASLVQCRNDVMLSPRWFVISGHWQVLIAGLISYLASVIPISLSSNPASERERSWPGGRGGGSSSHAKFWSWPGSSGVTQGSLLRARRRPTSSTPD